MYANHNQFILDDCYAEINRSDTGSLVPNAGSFPNGMLNWTKSVNQYGIKPSAYSSNGYKTCAGECSLLLPSRLERR